MHRMKRPQFSLRFLLLFVALCAVFVAVAVPMLRKKPARSKEIVGIRLAGHTENDSGRAWQFEIVMEGHDLYYRKEWGGVAPDPEGRFDAEGFYEKILCVDDFYKCDGESWGSFGGRGGGVSGQGGKNSSAVARRLWNGATFAGITDGKLSDSLEGDHFEEKFSGAISPAHFPVPCNIVWTDKTSQPAHTTTYSVEYVEFKYQSNRQFFEDPTTGFCKK